MAQLGGIYREPFEKWAEARHKVDSLCAKLDTRIGVLLTLATELEFTDQALANAIELEGTRLLFEGLDELGMTAVGDILVGVVEECVATSSQFADALEVWLKKRKCESSDEDLYKSSDERGHGRDAPND